MTTSLRFVTSTRLMLLLAIPLVAFAITSNVGADEGSTTAPASDITEPKLDLKITTDQPWNIFDDASPIKVHITGPLADAGPLVLTATDVSGQKVFQLPLEAANANTMDVPIDAAGKHYLKLTISHPNSKSSLGQATLVVVPKDLHQDKRFGFNAYSDQSPLAKRLGAYWVRNHMPWQQDGPDKPLSSNGIDKTIKDTHDAGCEVFGISNYALPWATTPADDDKRPMKDFFSPPKPEYWAAYIQFAAAHIKGRVPAFEVWNEPNLDMFWRSVPNTLDQRIEDYSAVLLASYPILKKDAPDLKVTTGSICNTSDANSFKFFEGLIAHGCKDSFDILNLHFYTAGWDPEAKADAPHENGPLIHYLRTFKDLMAKNGIDRPIWLTEIGWSTTPYWGTPRSEIDQCMLVTRTHLLAFSQGVEVIDWFKLDGEPFGIIDLPASPKPAVASYAQMVHALEGKTLSKDFSTGPIYAMRFTGKTESVIIAWAVADAQLTLPPMPGLLDVRNNLGEKMDVDVTKPVKLSASPIYITAKRQ